MKPEESEVKESDTESPVSVTGDVIGDTAYSERFVLKILLKLANLDTLKHEIQDKSFEDDLCTLWDMTAEKDVVLFLQKHEILNLFNFTLPMIDSPRIIEIIVGIIGNMCCHKEVVAVLLRMESFLTYLMDYMKTDDSLILIQILRLISCCLFSANNDDDIIIWMNLFTNNGYSTTLYFILKNSSNKNLLITALENLNTVSSYCNTEKFRTDFFNNFITSEALESLSSAFTEIAVNQKHSCERDELERILVISLQIMLNIAGFDKSSEICHNKANVIINIIRHVLSYYEDKLVNHKEIDSDLVDIIDSANTILRFLPLDNKCEPDCYFVQGYSMWKALKTLIKSEENGSNFEEEDKEEVKQYSDKMKSPLGLLICIYMEKCSENNLFRILDDINVDYDDIINSVKDKELQAAVSKRATNYRTRLKENVDS